MLTEKELEVMRRRAAGESQRAIAQALKVTQAAVSKFETNAHRKVVEAEELLKLTRGLGVATEQTPIGKRVVYKGGRR